MMVSRAWKFDVQLTRANLIALAGLCMLACLALGVTISGMELSWFAGDPPIDRARIAAATEKIDPNTASVASLRRLPGIGVVRAEGIVGYRNQHGAKPFRSPADLEKIHGIGPGTVNKISPYLEMPPKTSE